MPIPAAASNSASTKEAQRVSKSAIENAEKIAGLEFTDAERELMLEDVNELLGSYESLRETSIDNSVPPALEFNPVLPGVKLEKGRGPLTWSPEAVAQKPDTIEGLAFWPVTQLARLMKSGKVSSVELTKMYLARLKKLDPVLECVISLTEELALTQAERCDKEISMGRYRGPLHGIPWGAKDLLSAPGYRTTWGAMPFKDQRIEENATVVHRLEEAGAVLAAKLTLGALAWGDVWYGGKTKSPWNLEQGSSGSSAGPGAATAAGLVGFSIGTETWGSIISPATRCGVTGLRPTFGRVSRYGAMALSWSMDKIGPMCRSVEDCAFVFHAIHGPDGKDNTIVDAAFNWVPETNPKDLRIGYLKSAFEEEREDTEWAAFDQATLDQLSAMGFTLVPIELPDFPVSSLSFILSAEAAAAFDELTRTNKDDLLVRQVKDAWPNVFREARTIPAVEYIQANRIRKLLMLAMADLMSDIDIYVAPTFGGSNLLLTNLTGHPAVVLPNGFRVDGTPTSITFTGRLFGEAETLAVAKAYQDATEFHLKHPALDP